MHTTTKKIKSMIILLLVFFFVLAFSKGFTAKAEPKTIVVPDDFVSVFDAVEAASEGDTIYVKSGTYSEYTLVIDKTLSLIGEDPKNTVIENTDTNSATIKFDANYVKITGFTITGAFRGIEGTGNNTQIIDNIIIAEGNRLTLSGSHQTIAQNVIKAPDNATTMLSPRGTAFGTACGIRCCGSYNNICANEFAGPSLESIMLESCINVVYGNNIKNSGFMKVYGDRNIISGNNMTGATVGIWIYTGSNNIICANRITNGDGLSISSGYENTLYANHVTNSLSGVSIERLQSHLDYKKGPWTMNNTIYKNNFINNTYQASTYNDTNIWDNGIEGNFWSDYTGKDSNGDGIGDTPYVIASNRQDNYPLMAPITIFDAGTWEWTQYNVSIISNSTISDFSFNPEEGSFIRFNVEGEAGTTGFCRVTIPKDLLNTEDYWTVLVDGNPVTPTVKEDANNTYLYFTYRHSIKTVEIIGTDAIPEFPSWLILPLFLMTVLFAVALKKRIRYRSAT